MYLSDFYILLVERDLSYNCFKTSIW